jgi:ferrochelatase
VDGYDAFLLVSFGGPEAPADVMPFLRNVTRGRGVPDERLAEVAHHYQAFGGVSPINQQCRDLLAAIGRDFAAAGVDLPLYWGNRNWHPFLAGTVAQMAADGVRRALAFVTSPYGSYSSCRQYLDDIAAAREQAGPGAPAIDKIRHYFNHPGFIGPFAGAAAAAIASLPAGQRHSAPLVFTAHSIPQAMADTSGPDGGRYEAQLMEVARLVAGQLHQTEELQRPWRLVYQSRSGPPSVPWLGPDVCGHLADLAAAGVTSAVLVPVGFICDHVEVIYDLDTEAAAVAKELGMTVVRAATPGIHPQFVSMVTDLVRERGAGQAPQAAGVPRALGEMGVATSPCPAGCCPAPRRPEGASR